MDTMDIKHFSCFGPCMIAEWGLDEWRDEILARWNDINLYTMTRGINRFRGLAIALLEVSEKYTKIEGVEELAFWAENSKELSNAALDREISIKPHSVALKKALAWSTAVNKAITELPQDSVRPFPLAREALEFAHERADVAIVSSANLGAVLEEWEKHGLLQHTDIVLAQNSGSKAFCISELLKRGYEPKRVLMCGDAPGDLDAAEKNGVYFFPILVKKERESWSEFIREAFDRLLSDSYGGEYGEAKKREFIKNLDK
ncbi:MAG: HAD hydrolase-like protein [Clostridia bacterium]|nr:HAD hydrolase-like protein [Clostridia bacterium]